METYSFEFPLQNEIFKFIFTNNCNYRWKTTCLKSKDMFKNRIEKSSFFNEISLKYKVLKLPLDYIEREESQTCLIRGLKYQLKVKSDYTSFMHLL